MCLTHINGSPTAKKFIVRSQSADSWYLHVAVEQILGLSLPLPFKWISSGVPNFATANCRRLLPQKITELVPCRKYGKIIIHECEWAVHYQFFTAVAQWKWVTHFWLKPMKPMLSDFKSKVLLNLKTIWKQKSFKLLEDKICTVGVAWVPACNHGFRNFFFFVALSPETAKRHI